ncbi:MAG: 1-deoxy-D-xylulose-5-phosphate synthase [Clostridium sp.]|nr:1-deoxy-D-xylulose-5-phosphate synthase [Clostridium sp.]
MNLNDIHSPADIKKFDAGQLRQLADDMRQALITKLSRHGGHVGPNLGFVEATIALHYVFDTPADKIVFDVSHQTYPHKMLTGRMKAFTDPALYGSVSGFTNPEESPYDLFTIGHTSTAVSLAGGLAKARDLKGEHHNVIAVVGDGSLSGGEAFEGLDSGATLGTNFIVIINDNQMSIAENHGGLYENLRLLRETDGKAPCNYFRALGYDYRYVPYGNDVEALIEAFRSVKNTDHPVVVHVNTQKGKGLAPAEANKEKFHFSAPFDRHSGALLHVNPEGDYSSLTAEYLLKRMESDPTIAVITAGTPTVAGFGPEERRRAGSRFIDVGIAEQDAVALASGLAKGGCKPFFGVYSSFLQRTYDQLSQDVAINASPAAFGIFAGSLYGMTDVTHLGWFDIPLIGNIPGFVYLAPTCVEEYFAMLDWALQQTEHPVAIKVPGGPVVSTGKAYPRDYSDLNRFVTVEDGRDVAIIGAGAFLTLALDAAAELRKKGVSPTVINPRFVSGIDETMLEQLKKDHRLVVTLEDGVLSGGFGEKIARYYGEDPMRVRCYGLPKEFRDRIDPKKLAVDCHLTPSQIAADTLSALG